MKTLKLLQHNLLYILLTAGVWACGYYIGQERTFDKLFECAGYGVDSMNGRHYTTDSFERVETLNFGAFRGIMKIKREGDVIEWEFKKEYVRWDTCR